MADDRVRVTKGGIKVKQHRALASVARYINLKRNTLRYYPSTQEIWHSVTFRNGKPIKDRMKSIHQLASLMRVHPHFESVRQDNQTLWRLRDDDSYLLGKGNAYPPEYYRQDLGQNKKGQKIKRDVA